MPDCQTLIRADLIVTQNERREIIENGALAIDAGKILAAGPWPEIGSEWRGAEFLDLSGKCVLPGLINGHTHGAMTFLRGLADDQPLMTWLAETVFPVEARLTSEITRLGALLGHAEMLATGSTACVDMYIYADAVLEAAGISGIRCLGGEAVFQFPSAACPSWREALDRTAALAEKYAGHERAQIAVNPHSVYTTTTEILNECRKLALEMNLPLHIHLAETATETRQCLERHGQRPVDRCESLGLFDARLIAAHLVDINEAEMETLARHNVCGCHNPASNMKLASGTAPVAKMLAAGVSLGLGTDGPASNNRLNMFAEMSLAALLQKLASGDPAALPAQEVLDMATLGGAKILGRPDLGRLEAGFAADLIALDLKRPNMQPMHNPVSQIVYAATGSEICLTMVAGEILYENGKFAKFDYPALLDEIGKLRDFARRKN